MNFNLKTMATIKNLNIRKQGKGKEKEVTIDIKFEGTVDVSCLVPLLGVGRAVDISFLWRDDKDNNVLMTGLSEMKSWAGYQTANQTEIWLKIFKGDHIVDKLSKFSFVLMAGKKAELTFTTRILNPRSELVDMLAHNIMEPVHIEIMEEQGDWEK